MTPKGRKSEFNPVSEAQPGMVEGKVKGKVNAATHNLRGQRARQIETGMKTTSRGLPTVVCIP